MYKIEGFSRNKGGARELLTKEKKGQQDWGGREKGKGFYHADCLFLLQG